MRKFYLVSFSAYLAILTLGVCIHYFGLSPYGGRLEPHPMRFLPFALSIEVLVLFSITLLFQLAERICKPKRRILELPYLVLVIAYLIFNLLDMFMFRWLGSHLSASYFRTFFGDNTKYLSPGGFHFATRMVSSDVVQVMLTVILGLTAIFLAVLLWRRRASLSVLHRSPLVTPVLSAVLVLAFSFVAVASDQVKERVTPAIISIVNDGLKSMAGSYEPRDMDGAMRALMDYAGTGLGRAAAAALPVAVWEAGHPDSPDTELPFYPLLRQAPPSAALAAADRPNVVFIEIESWRGWETDLFVDPANPGQTPELDAFLREYAVYYPWTHSNGFPSAAGTLCLGLGVWPHYSKLLATDFQELSATSLPEALRQVGYRAEILVGAEPSISNFTTWFDRWFDAVLFDPEVGEDHLLVDQLIERTAELSAADAPFFLQMYTISTHIPFNVPESEGIAPADTLEQRFDQVIRYSTRQVLRYLEWLKSSPYWDNTVVVLVGDHAYPSRFHTENELTVGRIHPGLTWVNLAFSGGWQGLPEPGLRAEVASQIDVPATLAALLGITVPTQFMGRDLFSQSPKPLLAVREQHLMLQGFDWRVLFNLNDENYEVFYVDPYNKTEYGMLEGYNPEFSSVLPEGIDLESYREMVRAMSWLIENDRVYPAY